MSRRNLLSFELRPKNANHCESGRNRRAIHRLATWSRPAALLIAATTASAATAATPSAADALALRPVQPGVAYEQVPAADLDNCKVRDIDFKDWSGWEVIGPDGLVLRRFADTNGDKKVDLWCYYRYGIEVYRDVDGDFNGKADQYRWMGTEGIRHGVDDNEDGRIDKWRRISAEEASRELVDAIKTADASRFAALLASERELRNIGLGRTKARSLAEKALRAAKKFADLAKSQKAITEDAKWLQFAATAPGIVPAGTDDSTKDVVVYENAVAMYQAGGKSGQLMIGTMIQINDTYKLVDLPSLSDTGEAIEQTAGNFFRPLGGGDTVVAGKVPGGAATQELVSSLETVDKRLSSETDKKKLAALHDQRADYVEQLIAAATDRDEKDMWIRQLVDTIGFAVQSGAYPDGLSRMKTLTRKYARSNKELASYIDFQTISSEYAVKLQPGTDSTKVQEWYLDKLADFSRRYPKSPESAQAMLQLALGKEFENNEKEALSYYRKIASQFRGTDPAEKAAGAIRRLDSIGKPIELSGRDLDGRSFKLSSLRGRPVVIQYWAAWCEPCKQDAKQLRRLQAQFKRAGLQIVGVNIDTSRADAAASLKQNPMPWTQLFEEGGLESSPLAKRFGVQTLPTMMLVDKSGKLVRHNVTVAELPTEIEKIVK